MGQQNCYPGGISITQPVIGAPSGKYVYAIDAVYTKLNSTTNPYHIALAGDEYYQGTVDGSVFVWTSLTTSQTRALNDTLDAWTISSGYDAEIIQWVWDNNQWYYNSYTPCGPY